MVFEYFMDIKTFLQKTRTYVLDYIDINNIVCYICLVIRESIKGAMVNERK